MQPHNPKFQPIQPHYQHIPQEPILTWLSSSSNPTQLQIIGIKSVKCEDDLGWPHRKSKVSSVNRRWEIVVLVSLNKVLSEELHAFGIIEGGRALGVEESMKKA
jgi:hypothetical protein